MKSSLKIVAIMSVYNEELYLPRCLNHLWEQGIQTYIIDNGSLDRTSEIASSFLNRGVIHVEEFPRYGMFELERLLRREEEVALELGAGWYIHHDADEIRQAPNPYLTLAEGILAMDRAGYNAVNFDEFVFTPTGPEESFEHKGFVDEMQYYYFLECKPQNRINAWKNYGQTFDLHSSGGHQVQFEGRRLYPQNFILRHYMVLSYQHAVRKYCGRVYSEVMRREKGWDNVRASLHPSNIQFPDQRRLCRVSTDNTWDRSDPWKVHPIFERASLLPREEKIDVTEANESLIPAPFIVGVEHSGTALLRLMLNGHPDLAILSGTHFFSDVNHEWSEMNDNYESFFQAIVKTTNCDNFDIDSGTLKKRIASIKPFNLAEGLRVFYKFYAENFGKLRWGEETPSYALTMELIHKVMPEARFIHIIRDGRDVALLLRKKSPGSLSIEDTASQWVWMIAQARRQAQNLTYYMEVQYEKLILKPRGTLKQICKFISLPWNPAIHSYRTEQSKIGAWQNDMTNSEIKSFEAIAGTTLRELDYEID